MKVFFNHLPKCGGTSFWHWIKENTDYEVIKVWEREDEESLHRILLRLSHEDNILIGGHTYAPTYMPDKVKAEFWSEVYKKTDYRFTVLRNPISRLNSFLHFSGKSSKSPALDPECDFFYGRRQSRLDANKDPIRAIHKKSLMSLESCLESILPENYLTNLPINANMSEKINDYPKGIGLSGDLRDSYYLPLSMRGDKSMYFEKMIRLMKFGGDISDVFGITGNFALFAIEDVHHLINVLVDKGIVRSDYSPFPVKNKTSKLQGFDEKSLDSDLVSRVFNEYPESYVLWRIALLRVFS